MAQITYEGQSCPHCGKPVTRREGKINWKRAMKQTYYYEYFFKCMNCRAVYLVPQARREITEEERIKILGEDLFAEKYNQAEKLF
jgi:uncharacterized protein with PIN domain